MQLNRRNFLLATGAAVLGGCATTGQRGSGFAVSDDGKHLAITENDRPVCSFNYAQVDPPSGVPEKFRRANYIHPLYSPGGAVVTDDFPADHFHHRGVFWAWPNCHVGDRKLNVWELEGARTVSKGISSAMVYPDSVRFTEQAVWQFDEDKFAPIEEEVQISVFPAKNNQRAIEFLLKFKNITDADISFQGSAVTDAKVDATSPKGYGGFCFRPNAKNKPFTFTTINGVEPEDKLSCNTPWADIVWGDSEKRGVTIMQHPSNPGYPHSGWIFRHYGFLGASWPHNDPYTLKAGQSLKLQYRLLVHEGDASTAQVAKAARQYQA